MGSFLVVVADPASEIVGTCDAGAIQARVGPFPQHRLDESLGFTVGARRVGARAMVAQAHSLACSPKAMRPVASPVVGKQGLDGDALPRKPSTGAPHERGARGPSLVGQDLSVGQAREVIDSHMYELPARSVALAQPAARDAMSGPIEAGGFLDVQVQELAGMASLVAARRFRRLERSLWPEDISGQDRTDRGNRHPELL